MRKNPITIFIKEAIVELKKVVWPSRKEVANKTLIVVISMIVIALIVGALDYGLSEGVKALINIK